MKFAGFSLSGTGHTGEFFIHPEIILNGNGGVGLGFLFDLDTLLGFNRLVQPITPATSWHQTTGVFIHNHHLSTLDHILLIFLVESISSK